MGLLGKGRPDSNKKGQISEAAIAARLLQAGYVVLTPYGGTQRYDLVVEDADGKFWRIQCKSAWIDEGGTVLKFDTPTTMLQERKEIGVTIEDNVNISPFTALSLIRCIWFQLTM